MAKSEKPKLNWTTIKSLPKELSALEKTYRDASKVASESRDKLVEAIRERLAARADVKEDLDDDHELVVIPKFGQFIYAIAPRTKGKAKGIAL